MKDFFISYNSADRAWAVWIDWLLRDSGYSTIIQANDFRPGENFVLGMHQALSAARQTLLVLSQNFLDAEFTQPEWAATFVHDPTGKQRKLIPVRVKECAPPGLFAAIVYIDLVGKDEDAARSLLLEGVKERTELTLQATPAFPGTATSSFTKPEKFSKALEAPPQFPGSLARIWNITHHRNPHFTGREELLADLHAALTTQNSAALTQALAGLGGVGKTQLALEYAYRHASAYDIVWWLRAEETATLAADFAALSQPLALPEKDAADQNLIVQSVLHWLNQHPNWLLIFDNAQDARDLRPYLPHSRLGRVLITSRNANWSGTAHAFGVKTFSPEEAAAFLCARTGQSDAATATALAHELGYLPLALEQAAAYMTAAQKSLADYVALFRQHQQKILERGKPATDYPFTVATTWELAFERVAVQCPAAVELLNLCSFLAPEAIPRGLLSQGLREVAAETQLEGLAEELTFDDAIMALRNYSLIEAQSETLALHRLVQAVTREKLSVEEKKRWAEAALLTIDRAWPSGTFDIRAWPDCARLLPHAYAVDEHCARFGIASEDLAALLNRMGFYLYGRANYSEAEPLFCRSLAIREQQLGPLHPDVAQSLNNLAELLRAQGKYDEADPLSRRSLAIREQQLGPEHPDVALSLNNLAELLRTQGKYIEAEPLYRRSLAIREQQLGPEHPDVATSLNNLAALLESQGKYSEADPLYRRSLAIWEKQLGPEHPDVATSLNNLAGLLKSQGKYSEADPFYRRSLAIREQQLGPEHPDVAQSLNNLAALLESQGKYSEAEPLSRRSLAIREQQLGPEHPHVATSLNNLAGLLESQGKYSEAEPLFRRAVEICEKSLGADHPNTQTVRENYAQLSLKKLLAEMKPSA